MHLLDCDSTPIQPPLNPSRSSNMLNLLHASASYRHPSHAEQKVLMLHGVEFRSLGRATDTPSSAYKPLHEYRILQIVGTYYQRDFPPKEQPPSVVTSTASEEEEVYLAENEDGDRTSDLL
ncbi:hypothetical protein BHE74_00011168 [Ensete ventricosum]|nr:hypothetical protein BHE74_00011168 [Ensete ventricosum]